MTLVGRTGVVKITAVGAGFDVHYRIRVLSVSDDGLRMFVVNEATNLQEWCDAADVVLDDERSQAANS
jgi:hypothetical protein